MTLEQVAPDDGKHIPVKFWPKQMEATLAADRHMFTLFGGARGPGKSYWLRWWLLRFLILCHEMGVDGVVVGLFCETYPDLTDRQSSKIEREFPKEFGVLKESKAHGFGFHLRPEYGGGVIALRNLDDPSKYQSAEFAAIAVDELTKNPFEVFDLLRGSLRWPGIKNVRFVAATNPGSIGHLWVKRLWIDRDFPEELESLADEFVFVRALPDDNPSLDASYWHMLETLTPALAKAWRWGDWDAFVGQFFDEFLRSRHIIRPIELPKHYIRWRAVDWGYANPFCCLWLAQDPDIGRVFAYREVYEIKLTDRQQAALILANTPKGERINITYADPSMWTKKTHEAKTFSTADEYRAAGVPLQEADNNRRIGWSKIRTLLAPGLDGLPMLLIFETCEALARTLPALPYDKNNSEDVDTAAEDHPPDALRYGLTRVNPRPLLPPAGQVPTTRDRIAQLLAGQGLASRDM